MNIPYEETTVPCEGTNVTSEDTVVPSQGTNAISDTGTAIGDADKTIIGRD